MEQDEALLDVEVKEEEVQEQVLATFPDARPSSKPCICPLTSKLILACYDAKTLLARSKQLRTLFEHRFKMRNVQVSFPLYPIFEPRLDKFTQQTLNTGVLGHLALNASELAEKWRKPMPRHRKKSSALGFQGFEALGAAMIEPRPGELDLVLIGAKVVGPDLKGPNRKPYKSLKDFKLGQGLPYEIVNIGRRLSGSSSHKTTTTSGAHTAGISTPAHAAVYEVELKRNNLFFFGTCKKNPRVEKALALVKALPLTSDLTWKQMSLLVAKRYPSIKETIFEQLWVPDCDLNPTVQTLLRQPSNMDIRDKFFELRQDLTKVNNSAYTEAVIYSLLSVCAARDWCPLFTKVFDTARGQAMYTVADPYIEPVWRQVIVAQYTASYYHGVLAMHSSLNALMLMAHLFQVCFGLDFAQNVLGFVHRNLNVRTAVGYVNVDKDMHLFYKWYGKYYRVPTFGKILKLTNMNRSSFVIGGIKHTSDKALEAKLNPEADSFNMDLLRLGATLKAVLRERQTRLESTNREVITTLTNMLHNWTMCFNDPDITGMSDREVNMVQYRTKCMEMDDIGGNCEWKAEFEIPSHLSCPKALPAAQCPFFKMFEIPEADLRKIIPAKAIIYKLE